MLPDQLSAWLNPVDNISGRRIVMIFVSTVRSLIVLALVCCASTGVVLSQNEMPTPQPSPSTPAQATQKTTTSAHPSDVASVDSIIAAVYDVISGPASKKRDWDRMRSLFVPGARLIPTGPRSQSGGYGSTVLTVDEFIQRSNPFLEKEGFFEKEVARKSESFGQIAHVFSTYESRHTPEDPKPCQRGINSIQLMNDGKRWWIITIFWQAEDEKNPLPEEYLKKEG
jgi:hypothetical protein